MGTGPLNSALMAAMAAALGASGSLAATALEVGAMPGPDQQVFFGYLMDATDAGCPAVDAVVAIDGGRSGFIVRCTGGDRYRARLYDDGSHTIVNCRILERRGQSCDP